MAFGRGNSMAALGSSPPCWLKSSQPQRMERLSGLGISRFPPLQRPTTPCHHCLCTTSLPPVPIPARIKEDPSFSPGLRRRMKTALVQSPLDSPNLHEFLRKVPMANCGLCEQLHPPRHSTTAGPRRRSRTWRSLWCNEGTG